MGPGEQATRHQQDGGEHQPVPEMSLSNAERMVRLPCGDDRCPRFMHDVRVVDRSRSGAEGRTGGTMGAPSSPQPPSAARSAPIVVSSPWPVCTTVSSGSANSRARIDSTIRSASLNDRPVAPGPALEEGVAGEHAPEVGGVEADRARARGRACAARVSVVPPTGDLLAVGEVDVPEEVGVGELPQRPVVGVQQDRRAGRLAQRGRDPHVVVVGVGAHDRLHRAVADHGEDRRRRRAARR